MSLIDSIKNKVSNILGLPTDNPLIGLHLEGDKVRILSVVTDGDPKLKLWGETTLQSDAYSGNSLNSSAQIVQKVTELVAKTDLIGAKIATAAPGPAVFSKTIKVPKMDPQDLAAHINLEASAFLPSTVSDVKISYHIIGPAAKGQLEVLVVAVKSEVVTGIVDNLKLTGLETIVVDVEHFALQNAFEFGYGDEVAKSVGLIYIGPKYTLINVCKDGESLFTADVNVGTKSFVDALAEDASVEESEALDAIRTMTPQSKLYHAWIEARDRTVEYLASEITRQLSFFWGGTEGEEGLDVIYLSGEAAQFEGVCEEMSEKTGVTSMILNPFSRIVFEDESSKSAFTGKESTFVIPLGLALRREGDQLRRE
jgi:type IV pilus assembly protein PilM